MHVVQLLLPLYTNDGTPFARERFGRVRAELAERFGGVTAYSRAPAEGLWVAGEAEVVRDDVVVFEVMAEELDRAWWASYRSDLERRFEQEEIVVRAIRMERL